MKVSVIGYGNVGMAVFNELLHMPEIYELNLVGRNLTRIKGEIDDYRDSIAVNSKIQTVIGGGGYESLEGSDIVVVTAGPATHDGQTRLQIAAESVAAMKDIARQIKKYAKNAIIVALTNPVDIVVSALIKYTGFPRQRVIGTGTLLDSARLKREVAEVLGIKPKNVVSCVLGEHGDSSCIIWSWMKILGMTLEQFLKAELDERMREARDRLLEANRTRAYEIIAKKGATAYGVAAATSTLVSAIIHDTHEILPISVMLEGEFEIDGVALSVPCYVNRQGATIIKGAKLSDREMSKLKASAEVIRKNSDGIF